MLINYKIYEACMELIGMLLEVDQKLHKPKGYISFCYSPFVQKFSDEDYIDYVDVEYMEIRLKEKYRDFNVEHLSAREKFQITWRE